MSDSPQGHPKPPEVSAASFQKGEALYRSGAYPEALILFEQMHRAAPQASAPLRMVGLCRLRMGAVEEAVGLLTRALSLSPQDPFAQLQCGMGLHAVGRSDEAARLFRESDRQLPDDPAPPLNLAAALLALDRADEALEAALEARRRAPDLSQAGYMVGQSYLALGRPLDAEYALSRCLQQAPRFADAWVGFGAARYRQHDLAQAVSAMRRALDCAPMHLAAASNLAVFLRMSGQLDSGEALLKEVLDKVPTAHEVRLNLAVAYLQEDRAQEARDLLDAGGCPDERRQACHWRLQRALALLILDQPSEARETLRLLSDVPEDMAVMLEWRRVLLARADGDTIATQTAIAQMEAQLAQTSFMLPENAIMAHFDLAKVWSQDHVPDRAFPHWVAGHALLGRFQPFSRLDHRRLVDGLIRSFDRPRLHEGPRASNADHTPVFIVGLPRSGTTLAEQILAAHAQVHGAGERRALAETVAKMAQGGLREGLGRIIALDQIGLDAYAAPFLKELQDLAPGADRIVDKMPGNLLYLGVAALLFPKAKIIHCTRDPRDIGLSIFMHRFFGAHPYAHDLGDLGWYIGQQERLMTHWKAVLPNPILTLPLTDWIEDFDITLARVLGFLDLPHDPACLRFYEQDSRVRTVSRRQVREPVNDKGIGRWRVYETQLQPLIEELRIARLSGNCA